MKLKRIVSSKRAIPARTTHYALRLLVLVWYWLACCVTTTLLLRTTTTITSTTTSTTTTFTTITINTTSTTICYLHIFYSFLYKATTATISSYYLSNSSLEIPVRVTLRGGLRLALNKLLLARHFRWLLFGQVVPYIVLQF